MAMPEDIHQGPVMVMTKFLDDVANVHGFLTFCPLPD